jgi:hypothetical protein
MDGNSVVTVDRYPDGYYATDDPIARAVPMIRGRRLRIARSRSFSTTRTAPSTRRFTPSRRRWRLNVAGMTAAGTSYAKSASRARSSSASSRPAHSCRHGTANRVRTSSRGTRSRRPNNGCSRATWKCTRRWSNRSTRARGCTHARPAIGRCGCVPTCAASFGGSSKPKSAISEDAPASPHRSELHLSGPSTTSSFEQLAASGQSAVAPPSATSVAAVTKLDSSESGKQAAAAISSGSPKRAWIECGTAPSS